ncbi:DUF4817 domain-containing protein [Trichonephila clavata]|uniref:DUF4817 domain-containing protein n=1 Tax=Trichonephila clavata TaxID=2740835 RepID=A0A8X6KUD7_TRICU|nr:DUF4817 domain-containing protein [Trichonephila clavata]
MANLTKVAKWPWIQTRGWEYARRYPSLRPLVVNVIRRLDDRLRNTGSVWPTANLHNTGIPRSGLTVAQADAILHRVEEPSKVSTRGLLREMTSTKSTVHRLLWSERLLPFRCTTVECLKPDDCQKRVAFCEWLLQQQNTDNGFIAHILLTDEACFTRDGVFNHHNSHMWSQVNPHKIRPQKRQERWCLNVWAVILGDRLLEPYLDCCFLLEHNLDCPENLDGSRDSRTWCFSTRS